MPDRAVAAVVDDEAGPEPVGDHLAEPAGRAAAAAANRLRPDTAGRSRTRGCPWSRPPGSTVRARRRRSVSCSRGARSPPTRCRRARSWSSTRSAVDGSGRRRVRALSPWSSPERIVSSTVSSVELATPGSVSRSRRVRERERPAAEQHDGGDGARRHPAGRALAAAVLDAGEQVVGRLVAGRLPAGRRADLVFEIHDRASRRCLVLELLAQRGESAGEPGLHGTERDARGSRRSPPRSGPRRAAARRRRAGSAAATRSPATAGPGCRPGARSRSPATPSVAPASRRGGSPSHGARAGSGAAGRSTGWRCCGAGTRRGCRSRRACSAATPWRRPRRAGRRRRRCCRRGGRRTGRARPSSPAHHGRTSRIGRASRETQPRRAWCARPS